MIYCYSDAPKHDQARELERQVQEFLANGGKITTYPPRNVKPKTRKKHVCLMLSDKSKPTQAGKSKN